MTRQELLAEREALRNWFSEMGEEWAETTLPPEVQRTWDANQALLDDCERQLANHDRRVARLRDLSQHPGNLEPGQYLPTPARDGRLQPMPEHRQSRDLTADGRQPFVYLDSLQRAAVGPRERFIDHPALSAWRAARAEAEERVTSQYGGLGDLVRALSTTGASAVVPQVWAAEIIDRARNLSAVLQAGAVLTPMTAKVVQIGRLTADPTASFRAEGSPITASDPTFDNVTLTATTMNALVIGSVEWFQDAPNSDQIVTNAMAKAAALALDLAALFGGVTTGSEIGAPNNPLPAGGLPSPPNPRGILASLLANAPSSVLGGQTNGSTQTATTMWNEVLDAIYTPRDFNEAPNAMLWPSHLQRKYAKSYDTQGRPLSQPDDVAAITKFTTNQIPSGFGQGTGTLMSDLFVGDFREMIVGQRLDFTVQTLTERYAELGQVGLLLTWRGDVQLARPRAFSVFRYIQGT